MSTYYGCDACKHFHDPSKPDDDATCDAFPDGDGIPFAIISGRHIHNEPFPGDHGIMFERIEKEQS
jgi:hypothetical protein